MIINHDSLRLLERNLLIKKIHLEHLMGISESIQVVTRHAGEVLYQNDEKIEFIYFPITAIVVLSSSQNKEIKSGLAITGRDGLVGYPLVLGNTVACHKATIQNSGMLIQLPSECFFEWISRSLNIKNILLEYIQKLIQQMQHTLICSRHYNVQDQLVRWLLLTFSLSSYDDKIYFTQENMASILGARREIINRAAGQLRRIGAIEYQRGYIQLKNRFLIEKMACAPYRNEYQKTSNTTTKSSWLAQGNSLEKNQRVQDHQESYLEADQSYAYLDSRFEDIFKHSPVPQFILDSVMKIKDCNVNGCILLNSPLKKILNQYFTSFLDPEFIKPFQRYHQLILCGKNKESLPVFFQKKESNQGVMVHILGIGNEEGNESRLVIIKQ